LEEFVVRQESLKVQPSGVDRKVLPDFCRRDREPAEMLFKARFGLVVGREVDTAIESFLFHY